MTMVNLASPFPRARIDTHPWYGRMVSFQSIQITYPIKQWAIQFVTPLNTAKAFT